MFFLHVFVFSFLSPSRILPSRRPRYLAPAHHQETFGDFDPLHFELPKPFASDQPSVGTTATMSWAKGPEPRGQNEENDGRMIYFMGEWLVFSGKLCYKWRVDLSLLGHTSEIAGNSTVKVVWNFTVIFHHRMVNNPSTRKTHREFQGEHPKNSFNPET